MRPQTTSPQSLRCALLAATLAASLPLTARADYQTEVLSENPIVYYRFEDGIATPNFDTAANLGSLGAAGNGVYSTATVHAVAGALPGSTDKAARGANNAITIPFSAGLNNQGSFSVEVWLKPSAIPAAAALICPISSWRENTDTFGREGWLIYQGDAATGFNFRTYNKNAATVAASISSGAGVTAGVWTHVVATWDNTAAIARIYVNGVLKATSPVIAPGGVNSRAYEANTSGGFTLGSRSDNAFGWSGDIDEPAYYSTVLSDSQVLAHYNNGISATPSPAYNALVTADAPAGYWRLNEPAFTPLPAANGGSLGAAGNGGYYGGSKNTATGPSPASGFLGFGANNSCLALATENGNVSTGLSLLNNRTSFTVMGWVKRGATHSTRGGYFGQNDVLEFGDAGTGTQIEAWSAAGGQLLSDAPYPFADDEWGFITYVADGTKVQLYLNGQLAKSANAVVTNYGTSAFNFNIGGGGIFNGAGDFFRGEIDEVAIFDRAVTPGRVRQLYDTAKGNVAPGLVDYLPTQSPTGDIPEGQSYSLTVDPTGTPPFTYQWKLDGVDIPGATSRTYTVPVAAAGVSPGTPLKYTVTVTNGVDSVTSDIAEVYVIPTLKWTSTDATNPGKWDISALSPPAQNWAKYTGGAAAAYTDQYSVLFDDSASATAVTLTQDVMPAGAVFNNTTKNYTFEGPFVFNTASGYSLVKNGTGSVLIKTDLVYVDNLVVNAGSLQIGDGTIGSLAAVSAVTITGGEFAVDHPADVPYDSTTTTTGGRLSFVGTGDLITNATVSGGASEYFNRTGTVTVSGANTPTGGVTIHSGTVVFDGSQQTNRLAASSPVAVDAGATMEIRGVNALPTAANSVSPTLNQATLRVVSGSSDATGADGESHAHLKNLGLNGGSVILSYSGNGGAYDGESFQLNGDLTVGGALPSTIAFGTGATNGNAGIAPSAAVTHTIAVPNVAAGPDLTIQAELQNSDNATGAPTTILAKTGDGTLRLAGAIEHTYSGTLQIDAGTLEADGSIVGPVTIGSAGTIAPLGTFSTGAFTLSGAYACEIDGATFDKIAVNGNLTFSPGATLSISVLSGGATQQFYEIASCTGTLSGPLPAITGAPAGYALSISGGSLVLGQAGASAQPTIVLTGADGNQDFNSNGGGFSVSAAVSPETDWTFTGSSWHSAGQESGLGTTTDNLSYLTSPIYTLTQAGPITLSFTHRYNFEQDFDGGAVDVSLNGGAFTRVPASAFSQNPYNGHLAADVTHSLKDQDVFMNTSTGHPTFLTSVCTLGTGTAGDTVQVRFIAAYDNNTSGALTPPGWEIDSFLIAGVKASLATISWPLGTMQYSDNLQPPWTDIPGSTPLLIDVKAAPKRFFRLKP